MGNILTADDQGIAAAAQLIRDGQLVVMPTETVYGLAANALNFDAVAEIFRVKGRPATNPVIVHVASPGEIGRVAQTHDLARVLAAAFWPGPLTLVLEAKDVVPRNVTAGGTTVGVRMPNHSVALRLLARCGLPLAAPSANRSEDVSPTTVGDVIRSLGELSPAILDGGTCEIGIESTVVDLTTSPVRILRPGAISRRQLEEVLGFAVELGSKGPIHRSPGQMLRHYSPRTLSVLSSDPWSISDDDVAILHYSAAPSSVAKTCTAIQLPSNPAGYAAGMYAALNRLDDSGANLIAIETPPGAEEWDAVRDRLSRATAAKTTS